jgi:hypothetical protein
MDYNIYSVGLMPASNKHFTLDHFFLKYSFPTALVGLFQLLISYASFDAQPPMLIGKARAPGSI